MQFPMNPMMMQGQNMPGFQPGMQPGMPPMMGHGMMMPSQNVQGGPMHQNLQQPPSNQPNPN